MYDEFSDSPAVDHIFIYMRSAFISDHEEMTSRIDYTSEEAEHFSERRGLPSRKDFENEREFESAIIDNHIKNIFANRDIKPLRFSRNFNALYLSKDERTCIEERKFLVKDRLMSLLPNKISYRYHNILIKFFGTVRDIVPLSNKFPELLGDDHALCQPMGDICVLDGTNGIIYCSSRNIDGKNLVAFERRSVKPEGMKGIVKYQLDQDSKTVVHEYC